LILNYASRLPLHGTDGYARKVRGLEKANTAGLSRGGDKNEEFVSAPCRPTMGIRQYQETSTWETTHSGITDVPTLSMNGEWSRLWKKYSVETISITHAKEFYALDRQSMLAYRNYLGMGTMS
jgi:hypothetical protein